MYCSTLGMNVSCQVLFGPPVLEKKKGFYHPGHVAWITVNSEIFA